MDEKWGGKRVVEKGKNGLFMSVIMREGGEADHLVLASVQSLLLHLLCSGMNARDGFWFEALCVVWGCLLLDEYCNCNFEGVFVIGNEELRCCEESLCEENAKWDCLCFQFLLNCYAF